MTSLVSLLEISHVAIAALVALVPLLYPDNSLFRKGADKGIQSLQEWDLEQRVNDDGMDKTQRLSTLEPENQGFRQLESAIKKNTPFNRQIAEIRLIYEEPVGSAMVFTTSGMRRGERAELQAIDTNDKGYPLASHPFDVERVIQLRDLRQWVRNTAVQRSHYWTVSLVLIWSSLSIILVF